MNVYRLRVTGATDAQAVARVRWELFVFPEIRDVRPTPERETVAVHWEGGSADPARWCHTLLEAGYEASPAEPAPAPEHRRPAA